MDKLIRNIFKQEPLVKELRLKNLLTNSLTELFLEESIELYDKKLHYQDEQLIKVLLKVLEEKGVVGKRLKVLIFWIEISKVTKYDLSDILMNKKIKTFTKAISLKLTQRELTKSNMESLLIIEVLVPLYNFFLKLSVNDDLYRTCLIGQIPEDEVFRRGTKIRFIWIFKVYNLINLLIPIVDSLSKFLRKWPDFLALAEIALWIYNDILLMNNFIVKALQEGSEDNFLLMPYLDTMQFYESLTEQFRTYATIQLLFLDLHKIIGKNKKLSESSKPLREPKKLELNAETILEIETQALKIKLISNSLKNPKKDFTRLETQYNQKREEAESRNLKTEIHQTKKIGRNLENDFVEKFRNLDD